MGLAAASHSVRCLNPESSHSLHRPIHVIRTASSSSSKSAASKGKAAKPKPVGGAGASADAAAGSGDAKTAARVRTPEWARMPSQAEDLQELFRRRRAQLVKRQAVLLEEARVLESQGWSAAAKQTQVAAVAAALPIAPTDGGAGKLAAATAPGTPFEAALEGLNQLVRVGIVLGVDPDLTVLLRKAISPDQLNAALGLLRRNHLAQAAVRLGSHEARHGPLHQVLVQECQRLGSAAPLVELWDSLYEHGMEPSRPDACAAVQAAVAMGDGAAAAALLSLTSQYGMEPLAAAEAAAVVKLLDAGSPDAATKLRGLLPRLGM